MAGIQRLSGYKDLGPQIWRRFAIIQKRLSTFLDRRGYEMISTPLLESTDLFLRKSGGELAGKMYSFSDPGGRNVSLRPEFTSSVVRAYHDGALASQPPLRLQYYGSVFRYNSIEGIPKEFLQLGVELLGSDLVAADAEILALSVQALSALGVKGHRVRISHLGMVNSLFEAFSLSERARVFLVGSLNTLKEGESGIRKVRKSAIQLGLLRGNRQGQLRKLSNLQSFEETEQFVERLFSESPSGMIGQRTKDEVIHRYWQKLQTRESPAIMEKALRFAISLSNITTEPKKAIPKLRSLLKENKIPTSLLRPIESLISDLDAYDLNGVPVAIDFSLSRGIAYYNGVVFEIDHPKIEGEPHLGGGGRYDGLLRAIGGDQDIPALGYAYSLERISQLLPANFGEDEPQDATRVLVVAAEATMKQAVTTAERLRLQGIPTELDIASKTEAEAARYARRRGITTIIRVGKDGTTSESEY